MEYLGEYIICMYVYIYMWGPFGKTRNSNHPSIHQAAAIIEVSRPLRTGCSCLRFRGLGFRDLGLRFLRFRVCGFRVQGFRVWACQTQEIQHRTPQACAIKMISNKTPQRRLGALSALPDSSRPDLQSRNLKP